MQFFTVPKIFKKTCLKSMLCLFWGCCAFFCFLILGIGKSFKIKGLQDFKGWRGLNSQKFETQGGRVIKCLDDASWHAQKIAASEKRESKKQEIELGNRSLLLLYIFIFIFIPISSLVRIITLAYCSYYQRMQSITLDFCIPFLL